MYIKKSTLTMLAIILVLVTIVLSFAAINPFGFVAFKDYFKFRQAVHIMKNYYYENVDDNKLLDGALLGVAYSVQDPYTSYMDAETAKKYMEQVDVNDYTGIGLYIANDAEDNKVTVVSAFDDTPAQKAGLVTGDKILEINGEEVSGDNLDKAANMMKGDIGSEVDLKVLKKNSGGIMDLKLNRANIKRETVNSKMLSDGIGLMRISQFGVNTFDEFAQQFNTLVDQGIKKVVIDLRNNPGGYVEVAVSIADAFIDKGDIVYTLDKNQKKFEYTAKDGSIDIPIVILTNEGTASASEILAGALRDYNKAKIVGEKTYGKGVVQMPFTLIDKSMLKVTVSKYYTPSGVCIDKEGLHPDKDVKMDPQKYSNLSDLKTEDDEQLMAAIELLNKGE